MDNVLQELKADLKNCNSMEEIFAAVQELYDCEDKLGIMAKTAIVTQIPKFIKVAALKPHE